MYPDAEIAENAHSTYEVFMQSAMTKDNAREKLSVCSKFKRILLFFGIVRPYKGLTYLIEAMPGIISEIPDVYLLIVGEFWESREVYLKRINELMIDDHVKVIDEYVPNEDVAVYFSAADIVVLPYLSATGSGIVQIAFGCGKPVIATTVGSLPSVIIDRKTGYLVHPRDSEEIADAVISFYKRNMGHWMASNILRSRRRFSWDNMVNSIERAVQEIRR